MLSRFRQFSLILIGLFLMAQSPPPAPPAKTSVAIYPIKAVGAVDKSLAATLTSLLTNELTKSPSLIVIKESMLEEVMKRQAMNVSDLCDSTMCQVAIGELVQAQKMVVVELSKLVSRYLMTFDVVDVKTGAMDYSDRVECACSEDQLDLLVAAAGVKVRNHFGESLPIPPLPVSTIFAPPATAGGPLPQAASIANYAKRPASPEVIEAFFNFLKADNLPKVQEMLNSYEGLVNARDENDDGRTYRDQMKKLYDQWSADSRPEVREAAQGYLKAIAECPGKTPLHYAVEKGSKQLAEFLISQGATVNAKATSTNTTPLYFAAAKGDKMMCDLLIANGASINAIGKSNLSILHGASCSGNKEVVELIIKNGASVNAQADLSGTALHYAAGECGKGHEGDKEVVEVLLAHGADINAKIPYTKYSPNNEYTPLHFAAILGRKDVVEVLLAHGADPKARTSKGKTPLAFAEDNGHQEVADLLRQQMKKK